jgi:hypothetical protein
MGFLMEQQFVQSRKNGTNDENNKKKPTTTYINKKFREILAHINIAKNDSVMASTAKKKGMCEGKQV